MYFTYLIGNDNNKIFSEVKKVENEGEYDENLETEDSNLLSAFSLKEDDNIYPQANIKVEREQYSIFELNRKYKKKDVILDPEFQRGYVWNAKQKSELIESVIMGIPLPIFYLNETKEGKLVVVDGRQRLSTFFLFLDNEFKLKDLRILIELNGKKFSELDGKLQSNLEDFQLIAQVIKPPTPDRIKFDIFDRVNRGGTPLNQQEMRNALYQGKSTQLLEKLARNNIFKKATTYSINERRMKDRYIILRFLTFFLWRNKELIDANGTLIEYKNDIDDFLGKSMEYINSLDEHSIIELEAKFILSMQNNYLLFGQNAFRRVSYNGQRNPVNMLLFESFGYLFSDISNEYCLENKEKIKSISNEILAGDDINQLLLFDRGRGIVIPGIFSVIDNLKERLLNDF
jgi:hypothetical protein